MTATTDFDAVVIGAGNAGLTAAAPSNARDRAPGDGDGCGLIVRS